MINHQIYLLDLSEISLAFETDQSLFDGSVQIVWLGLNLLSQKNSNAFNVKIIIT